MLNSLTTFLQKFSKPMIHITFDSPKQAPYHGSKLACDSYFPSHLKIFFYQLFFWNNSWFNNDIVQTSAYLQPLN